jgi:hypothetical protein
LNNWEIGRLVWLHRKNCSYLRRIYCCFDGMCAVFSHKAVVNKKT